MLGASSSEEEDDDYCPSTDRDDVSEIVHSVPQRQPSYRSNQSISPAISSDRISLIGAGSIKGHMPPVASTPTLASTPIHGRPASPSPSLRSLCSETQSVQRKTTENHVEPKMSKEEEER